MLPLYATRDTAYFCRGRTVSRTEKIVHQVIENARCESSFSDRLVRRVPLAIHALSSKQPISNNIGFLLNFEPENDDKDSVHQLLCDEDMLKLIFSDTLQERSIMGLILPQLKYEMLDIRSTVSMLDEKGLVNFMKEDTLQNIIPNQSVVLNPLTSLEHCLNHFAPLKRDVVESFQLLQTDLVNTYSGVFSHHTHIETIPLECRPSIVSQGTQHNHFATQMVECLLQLKETAASTLLYNCKGFNSTKCLLVVSTEREMILLGQDVGSDTAAKDPSDFEIVKHKQWQSFFSTSLDIPSISFCGEVGEILPDFASEQMSHTLFSLSPTIGTSSGIGSVALTYSLSVQTALTQIQLTHLPTLTRTVPRGAQQSIDTSSSNNNKRTFMFAPPLLAHFAGTTQRLIDLESPWQLMPCQPNKSTRHYCSRGNNARTVHASAAQEILAALDVPFKQLRRIAPTLQSSSVQPSALNSHFLVITMDDRAEWSEKEAKKDVRNELQQFVETASMDAILDKEESPQVENAPISALTSAKRPHEVEVGTIAEEQSQTQQQQGEAAKKPRLEHRVDKTGAIHTSLAAIDSKIATQQQHLRQSGGEGTSSSTRAVVVPPHRLHEATTADAPLAAHAQLSVLPPFAAMDAQSITTSSTSHLQSVPPHAQPSSSEPQPSPHLPSFNFDFDLSSEIEGGLVEQYLRLQRGEASIPARGAPAGTRPAYSSSASRGACARASHYVTPQRPSAHPRHPDDSERSVLTTSSVAQVTPAPAATPAVSATAISDRDAVRMRVQQLAAHNITSFTAVEHSLTVLISESFLDKHFTQVAEGLGALGVAMLDCPLQEPISLILDAFTAVCVVSAESLLNTMELKALVKKLSEITFKFAKIHVIVVLGLQPSRQLNKALLTLTQAVSRFPAAVCLRQCAASPAALIALLEQLCSQSLRDAVAHQQCTGTTAKHFHRPFLDHLQHCDAKHSAHCEYLQLFPTVNFYTAAALLYHHPLRELVGQRAGVLCDLFAKHYVFGEELKDMLKSFVALLEAHAGLQLVPETV